MTFAQQSKSDMTKFTVSFLQHFRKTLWKASSRWTVSALATLLLLAMFVFLPIWDKPQNPSGDSIEVSTEKVSLVKLIAKAPPKKIVQAPAETRPRPKSEMAIASPNAQVAKEEPEEVPQPEQPDIPDNLEDTFPDDVERAHTYDENALYDPYAEHDIEGDSKEGSAEIAKAQETYKQYAKRRIASKKVYPLKARAQGQSGNVKVQLVIETDGSLSSVQIVQASAFELLNEAALTAVRKAAPFKKMVSGMKSQEYTFTLEFKLE